MEKKTVNKTDTLIKTPLECFISGAYINDFDGNPVSSPYDSLIKKDISPDQVKTAKGYLGEIDFETKNMELLLNKYNELKTKIDLTVSFALIDSFHVRFYVLEDCIYQLIRELLLPNITSDFRSYLEKKIGSKSYDKLKNIIKIEPSVNGLIRESLSESFSSVKAVLDRYYSDKDLKEFRKNRSAINHIHAVVYKEFGDAGRRYHDSYMDFHRNNIDEFGATQKVLTDVGPMVITNVEDREALDNRIKELAEKFIVENGDKMNVYFDKMLKYKKEIYEALLPYVAVDNYRELWTQIMVKRFNLS